MTGRLAVAMAVAVASLAVAAGALGAGPAGLGADEVDRAVGLGREWLVARQADHGGWDTRWSKAYPAGSDALCLLALLRSGSAADDPDVARGLVRLREHTLAKTYSVALTVLVIEAAFGPPADDPGRFDPRHGDGYAARWFQDHAPKAVKAWLAEAAAWLVEHSSGGYWRYPQGEAGDLSNTQLAVLALRAAADLGVRLPDGVWAETLDAVLAGQEENGPQVPPFAVPVLGGDAPAVFRARGWGYRPGEGARGSMTAGGVATLILLRDRLAGDKGFRKRYGERTAAAIADGLGWLAARFSIDEHPGHGTAWRSYWIYSLERCATLAGVSRLGRYDWYSILGRQLLQTQFSDGHWDVPGDEKAGPEADTCFALLFLTRATVPVAAPAATGVVEAEGPAWARTQDGRRYRVTFSLPVSAGVGSVHVAGTFNAWDPSALPMEAGADRVWRVVVDLEPGDHVYKFVLDGSDWRHDPGNSWAEPDGQGGINSVLVLPR